MLTFVHRNDKIPLRVTKSLTTESDYQTSVPITVYQGERPKVKDNVKLGHFDLGGIPPAKRGVPQVEVTFEIDEDSILHVSAIDTATKNTGEVTISSDSSHLTDDQIHQMVEDAEKYAEADKVWKERQEKAQEVEHYIYEMMHAVEQPSIRDSLGGIEKNKLKKTLSAADTWLESHKSNANKEVHELEEDIKIFEAKMNEVKGIVDPIIGKLYDGGAGAGSGGEEEEYHEEL